MSKGLQITFGAIIVAGLLGWYAYTHMGGELTFQYYQSLDEFMVDMDELEGRSLRVHGYVANQSIDRDLAAKRVRFSVQNAPPHGGARGPTLDVVFQGLETPDLFQDGAEVVIEGRIGSTSGRPVFVANNVMAKCPSKFEAQAAAGESGPEGQVNL